MRQGIIWSITICSFPPEIKSLNISIFLRDDMHMPHHFSEAGNTNRIRLGSMKPQSGKWVYRMNSEMRDCMHDLISWFACPHSTRPVEFLTGELLFEDDKGNRYRDPRKILMWPELGQIQDLTIGILFKTF